MPHDIELTAKQGFRRLLKIKLTPETWEALRIVLTNPDLELRVQARHRPIGFREPE